MREGKEVRDILGACIEDANKAIEGKTGNAHMISNFTTSFHQYYILQSFIDLRSRADVDIRDLYRQNPEAIRTQILRRIVKDLYDLAEMALEATSAIEGL
jgi:hypothetical protein